MRILEFLAVVAVFVGIAALLATASGPAEGGSETENAPETAADAETAEVQIADELRRAVIAGDDVSVGLSLFDEERRGPRRRR